MSLNDEKENINLMERKNIDMLVLYRSLYILKKKFELYKPQINQIYQENKKKSSNLLVLPITNIPQILKNIMMIAHFYIISYNRYSELLTVDLLNKRNKKQSEIIVNYIYNYIKEHIHEYNSVFYEKKQKEIQLKKEIENKNPEEEIEVNITLYNKKGKIIKSTEEIKQNNVLFQLEGPLYQISEEDIQILNSTQYLYSETIPLIIADYLQLNSNIVIVSSNEELNEEIKTLFDSEIIKKISFLERNDPKEEQNGKIKNLLFEEMNINQQIQIYENLVIEKNKTGENTTYLLNMIKQLKNGKNKVQNRINSMRNNSPQKTNINTITESNNLNNSSFSNINTKTSNLSINKGYKTISKIIPKSQMSKDELRKHSLMEIFYFYSKQHCYGKTFDMIKQNDQHLDLSEFSKFCVEFKILVKMKKLVELFKKNSTKSKQMDFNEFLLILPKLAISVNEEKKQYIESREKLYQMKLDEINEEEKKKIKMNEDNLLKEEKKEEDNNEENENKEDENMENEKEKNEENEEKKEENSNSENEEKKEKEIIKTQNEKKQKPKKKYMLKKNDQKKPSILLNTKEELKEKLQKLKEELNEISNKTHSQLIEEFYQYLEIDDENLYRKKMIGFILPFGMHDKNPYRFPQNIIDKKSKSKEKNHKELQEILIRRHEERELEKKLKEQKEKKILFQKKQKLFDEQNKILSRNIKQKNEPTYKKILKNKKEYEREKEDKITWDQLKKYDYDHFINITTENVENENKDDKYKNNNINNNDKVNEIFKNAENSEIIDSEDEELFSHLIGNSKNEKGTFINNIDKNNINNMISTSNTNIINSKDVINDISNIEKNYSNIHKTLMKNKKNK